MGADQKRAGVVGHHLQAGEAVCGRIVDGGIRRHPVGSPLAAVLAGWHEAAGKHAEFEMEAGIHGHAGAVQVGLVSIAEPRDGFRIKPQTCEGEHEEEQPVGPALHDGSRDGAAATEHQHSPGDGC